MQAYDKYKDSGIEWLGEIPEHWEVKKLKHFGYIYPGLSGKKGDDFSKHQFPGGKKFIPFTTISNQFQITKSKFQYVRVDERKFQHQVQKNDLLFLMSSETIEDIGKSSVFLLEERPYLNSFCKGFRIELFNLNSIFSNYLLNSRTYRKYFELYGRGFTRINIKQEFISGIPFGVPPLPEQQAIAAFLDHKCGKIDEAVRIKQQQIEKLKELRQITIHNAVTKGINPEAEMKDSGIDWIGEIPKHWEVKRLKYVFNLGKGLTITKENLQDSGIFCVSYGEIHSKYGFEVNPSQHVLKRVDESYLSKNTESLLRRGDFVFADTSEDIDGSGNFTYLSSEEQVFAGYHTVIARPTVNNIISRFLAYEFDSVNFRNQVRTRVKGVKVYSITQSILKDLSVWLPPDLEQQQIATYLDAQTSKIDKAIALKTEQIAKLNEYKQSLINDVVTGKIKVTN